jgi:hypothetical protein
MAYVYQHVRLDTNSVFYIGIGNSDTDKFKRAYRKDGRNSIWQRITKKTPFAVEIIHKDISWELAKEIEKQLIEQFKRYKDGGCLCNITLGGEGVLGLKRVAWNKGKKLGHISPCKGRKMSDDFKRNCSIRQKERVGKHGSNMLGKKHTKETREKMRLSKLNKKLSEDHIESIKLSRRKVKIGVFKENVFIESYESILSASKSLGIPTGSICEIIKNKRKIPKKYDYEIRRI